MSCCDNTCGIEVTYNNRKAVKAQREAEEKRKAEEAKKSLQTISCGKGILAISKIGSKVMVTFDDCSYAVADFSVVDQSIFVDKLEEVNKDLCFLMERVITLESKPEPKPFDDSSLVQRLDALEAKEDKDTVYDDSKLVERIEALENKNSTNEPIDLTELKEEVAKIKETLNNKVSSEELVNVTDLGEETRLFGALS